MYKCSPTKYLSTINHSWEYFPDQKFDSHFIHVSCSSFLIFLLLSLLLEAGYRSSSFKNWQRWNRARIRFNLIRAFSWTATWQETFKIFTGIFTRRSRGILPWGILPSLHNFFVTSGEMMTSLVITFYRFFDDFLQDYSLECCQACAYHMV